ncbi:DUF3800 domain-containing protein [Rhodoplanes sp. SY1]|uniref:DUF3800 domain-containing protein n=1 Tax=Rhodoplanes sp. SY1 TaxID=3166646 RepID=UPI0038B4409E
MSLATIPRAASTSSQTRRNRTTALHLRNSDAADLRPELTAMARVPASASELSEVYIDETSQNRHEYIVIGGLIIHNLSMLGAAKFTSAIRSPELNSVGEMKWGKVSKAKLPAYIRLVDGFFANPPPCEPFDIHTIVIDTKKLKDKQFNDGSREIGFNKEIYQLCQKFRRLYRGRLFHIYPDERRTPNSLEELRLILNRGARKNGDPREWPFRRVQFRDSKVCREIQVVDIFIGALAYKLNRHNESSDASSAKIYLSDYIMRSAGIKDVFADTAQSGRFTIWHRRLK